MTFFSYLEDNFTWTEGIAQGGSQTSGELTYLEQKIIIYLSTAIGVIGILSNSMSLSFFVRNWSRKLGDQLLVLLNILDFLVCFSGTINFAIMHFLQNAPPITGRIFPALYLTFVECTGYATTLLTVVRSVATYFPFYRPKQKYIAMVSIGFFVCGVAKAVAHVSRDCMKILDAFNIAHLVSLLLNIAVVFTANLLTMKKLYSKENTRSSIAVLPSIQANRHATITIFILSACFCFFNLLFSIVLCNYILGREFVTVMLRKTIVYCAVPMNSAGNPFVYFCRKREMRKFLIHSFTCSRKSNPEEAYPKVSLKS